MPSQTRLKMDFGRPIPLFPLDRILLLPSNLVPINVFEPRYQQMVGEALDGPGLIAMAVFAGAQWKQEYHGRPPLRPAVCVGHIIQHMRDADGRYLIILQGVCRARIVAELPAEEGTLYRRALLEPVGLGVDDSVASPYRDTFADALETEPLNHLRHAAALAEHLRDENVPTGTVLELLTITMVEDPEARYRLLETAEPAERARIMSHELEGLASLLRKAEAQRRVSWPKGVSWN